MDDKIRVVAVCGTEARIHSPLKDGRKLLSTHHFPTFGSARLFVQEYEDKQRIKVARENNAH